MPIKELQFSFSISVEDLARALALSNSGMKVQVLGTEATEVTPATPALPAPTRGGARHIISAFMREHDGHSYTVAQLRDVCSPYGYTAEAVYAAIYAMRQSKELRRFTNGAYRLTKRGLHG